MSISRRRFCQVSGAAGVFGLLPSAWSNVPSRISVAKLSGEMTSVEGAAVRELAGSLVGQLLLRGDYGYDGARRIWNGMHDRYPALIVRAQSTPDVVHAVKFARERELLLAIKGGGHSWPGQSVANDALMIDLSAINDVTVDPATHRARIGGGALLYDLDVASLRHNLVTTTGIVSHTGVGGLTLGGGYGRLGRKFGLTIDSLLSAEIVTAKGEKLHLSADENQDLFWAIRGGGGNFGVVTEFEFSLHDVPGEMYGGVMQWRLADARSVLDYYAEKSAGFSNEMFMAPGMSTGADGSAWLTMDVCYCGDPRNAEKELAPLRAVARPVIDNAVPAAYLTMQTRMDGAARPGIRSYIKSGMVREFTPTLIGTMLEAFEPWEGRRRQFLCLRRPDCPGWRDGHRVAAPQGSLDGRRCFVLVRREPRRGAHCLDSCSVVEARATHPGSLRQHPGGPARSGRKFRAGVRTVGIRQEPVRSDEPVPAQQQYPACKPAQLVRGL